MTSDDHDHRHCLEMFEKLSEYIDGELDHATCEEIERHAKDCVACFSCMETLKKTVALCKNPADPEKFLRQAKRDHPKSSKNAVVARSKFICNLWRSQYCCRLQAIYKN